MLPQHSAEVVEAGQSGSHRAIVAEQAAVGERESKAGKAGAGEVDVVDVEGAFFGRFFFSSFSR